MSVPVLAVIGGLGTFTVWCVVVATHPFGRTIGFIWMGVGLLMYVGYRKLKGYSLTKTVEKVVVPVSMQADVDYDQILVPITGTRISDEMMVLACQLATEKNSAIAGLYVIEVPLNLPLDARLVNERAKADKVLQAGALIASQFKVSSRPASSPRGRRAARSSRRPCASAARSSCWAPPQAAYRQSHLRPHDGLRARPCALRGPPQPRPQGLSYGGFECRGRASGKGVVGPHLER